MPTKPTKVMFNIRLNPKQAERLQQAGVRLVQRDQHAVRQLIQKHAEEAEALGRDGFRGGRTDWAGNKQADSGTPVFGWKAEGRQYVSLELTLQDVQSASIGLGMELFDIHLVRKDKDHMYSLRLTFLPQEKVEETAALSKTAEAVIAYVTGKFFEHLHVFRNPDGSMTINPAHAVAPEDMAGRQRLDMNIRADGSIRCVPFQG